MSVIVKIIIAYKNNNSAVQRHGKLTSGSADEFEVVMYSTVCGCDTVQSVLGCAATSSP